MVKDRLGDNYPARLYFTCFVLALTVLTAGCGSGIEGIIEKDAMKENNLDDIPDLAPVPGDAGIITVSKITDTALTVSWSPATDDITPSSDLYYRVIASTSPDIDTLSDAESGNVIQEYTANINSAEAAGLSAGSTYYFNVIVRDVYGNREVYTMTTATTCRDLDNLTAFFPFSGDRSDAGPKNIVLDENTSDEPILLDTDRDGNADSSYYFRSAQDNYFYNYAPSSPLDITDELTVSVWVNLVNSDNDQKILGRSYRDTDPDPDEYWGWQLGVSGGKINPEIWDSSKVRYWISNGSVTSEAWTHLAITWKTGGKFRAYINGIMVDEKDASANPIGTNSNSQFRIGARPYSDPSFPVDGNIDDIRIYDWELNAIEVLALSELPAD